MLDKMQIASALTHSGLDQESVWKQHLSAHKSFALSYESRSRYSGQYGVDIVQGQHTHRHASLNGRTADI